MAEITPDKKADILISALEERYGSIHKIRERVQGVSLWALGLLAAAAGWLIQSRIHFHLTEAVLIGGGVCLAYWVLRHHYFRDLEIGFKKQMQTAARLEKMLHLYTPGYFSDDTETAYPVEWAQAGTSNGKGNYFRASYELIDIGLLMFCVALLLKICI